jgi:hypothetical protein
MEVTKVIQTICHLEDPTDVYSGNIESRIMDDLKKRFVNICFRQILIKEVVEIIERGETIFSQQRQDASCNTNVRFLVRGLVLHRGMTLHNCTVEKNQDGNIIARNPYSAIYIRSAPALRAIREGQTIVAKVGAYNYRIGQDIISVNALPFIPLFRPTVIYKVRLKKGSNLDDLAPLLDELEEEKKLHSELDPETSKFFTKLVNRYKSQTSLNKFLKLNSGRVQDIETVLKTLKKSKLLISFPDSLQPGTAKVVIHSADLTKKLIDPLDHPNLQQTPTSEIVVMEDPDTVLGPYIQMVTSELADIRKLCETYSTAALIKKNTNLWTIYKNNRKE